jgi:hypothetical protein
MSARSIALELIARGIRPVPVPIGKKGPVIRGWQHLEITPENVDGYFSDEQLNVGAIMGPRSAGLCDVDLDCSEALALAPHFLPRTGLVYGRASKRRSHHLYTCTDPERKASIKLIDENKAVIVELRLGAGDKGAQSIMPGSLHVSGERYEWDEDGERTQATCAELKNAIVKIAVGTVLMRHWPGDGRHEIGLGLGGFFSRAGWRPQEIEQFVAALCRESGPSETAGDHARTAREAAENYVGGGEARGLPWMVETFGEAVAKCVAKQVNYRDRNIAEPSPADGRLAVKIEEGKLAETADSAEEILKIAEVSFFERSNTLDDRFHETGG